MAIPVTQRWRKCCVCHCSCKTNCRWHLPGDVRRRVCFVAWGVNLVTVIFYPAWGCAPRGLCPEMERQGEAASQALDVCPGVVHGCGGWEGWAGQPLCAGFLGTHSHTQGQIGYREVALLTANQTCFLKAELCLFLLYDLSFGEGFGSPSVAQKLGWWCTG